MTKRSAASKLKRANMAFLRRHYPYVFVHQYGCNGICFYYQDMPIAGQPLLAEKAMYPDGSKPGDKDDAKCFSCGAALGHEDLQLECVRRVQ